MHIVVSSRTSRVASWQRAAAKYDLCVPLKNDDISAAGHDTHGFSDRTNTPSPVPSFLRARLLALAACAARVCACVCTRAGLRARL